MWSYTFQLASAFQLFSFLQLPIFDLAKRYPIIPLVLRGSCLVCGIRLPQYARLACSPYG